MQRKQIQGEQIQDKQIQGKQRQSTQTQRLTKSEIFTQTLKRNIQEGTYPMAPPCPLSGSWPRALDLTVQP